MIAKRGSCRYLLDQLDDRPVHGAGQGGGGALSIDELLQILNKNGHWRLLKRSIVHTDSTKAYRKLGPMHWPVNGALHDVFEGHETLREQEYTHTNLTHKKKVGVKVHYAAKATVTLPNGEELVLMKGTEKVDGYWASLRSSVGRTAVNTGSAMSSQREWLLKLVRVHQWHFWHLGVDRFNLFGKVLSASRLTFV